LGSQRFVLASRTNTGCVFFVDGVVTTTTIISFSWWLGTDTAGTGAEAGRGVGTGRSKRVEANSLMS
jgi:hypothetical protein